MTMRLFNITVGRPGGEPRVFQVPSETGVEAGDAAVARMSEDESILAIQEMDDRYQEGEAPPRGAPTTADTFAEELSSPTTRTSAPFGRGGDPDGANDELLIDGQEEVFSRTEVELGRIEHKPEADGADDPSPRFGQPHA